ncbi:MAG: MFS transporter [Anaerolineales bacterium]|nr:MFS transporter [Anaerolineales bacterium]
MTRLEREAPAAVSPLRVQLVVATLARAVMNTAHRMVYALLPALSRGLGVPLEALTGLLSLRGALGMASPLFGGLPDRYGRRHAMLIGVAVFCAGVALVGVWPSYYAFAAYLILVVVAKFIFDPALQTYLGDRTPYARRGLVIAFTEIGWSGAALVGIPLAGLLIARAGWRAPFLPLAALGAGAGAALWAVIPRDAPAPGRPQVPGRGHLALIWRNPAVVAAFGLSLLISTANETLNVVYAVWLEGAFGLSVAELGLSATVIGLAELAGEGLVMALADRLGKRRSIAVGLAASAAAYLALPTTGGSLALALGGLFLVFIAYEFTIVATLPLLTELVPEARGWVMSTGVAVLAAGRMLGALLGGFLFPYGFAWNGMAGMACNLAALAVIVLFVRERR